MIDGPATCVRNKGQSVGCNHIAYSTKQGIIKRIMDDAFAVIVFKLCGDLGLRGTLACKIVLINSALIMK